MSSWEITGKCYKMLVRLVSVAHLTVLNKLVISDKQMPQLVANSSNICLSFLMWWRGGGTIKAPENVLRGHLQAEDFHTMLRTYINVSDMTASLERPKWKFHFLLKSGRKSQRESCISCHVLVGGSLRLLCGQDLVQKTSIDFCMSLKYSTGVFLHAVDCDKATIIAFWGGVFFVCLSRDYWRQLLKIMHNGNLHWTLHFCASFDLLQL